jgi:hypothetical protein
MQVSSGQWSLTAILIMEERVSFLAMFGWQHASCKFITLLSIRIPSCIVFVLDQSLPHGICFLYFGCFKGNFLRMILTFGFAYLSYHACISKQTCHE